MSEKKKLLMHVCCAPCATAAIERMREDWDITAFFYNPNIYPREEHKRRLAETVRFCKEVGIPLVIGAHDEDRWREVTEPFADEPEGGRRCRECIGFRLRVALEYAEQGGFDALCTVLSVSPHKDVFMIDELGEAAAADSDVQFLTVNFRKRDGYKRSLELSREHQLYRQDYCGCVWSLRERDAGAKRKRE